MGGGVIRKFGHLFVIRLFKIDCLFCASAHRICFDSNRNTHTKTRLVPEHKTFFGLKKYPVEAEKTAFTVWTGHSGAMWSFWLGFKLFKCLRFKKSPEN